MFKGKKRIVQIAIIVFVLAGMFAYRDQALAQGDPVTSDVTDNIVVQIDTIWLFLGAFLVFFMQAGFAMVESGFSRAKNAANLMLKNIIDFAAGSILYFAIGFGLMYGTSAGGFIGTDNFFLRDIAISTDNAYGWVDFLYQVMFAGAAATIVSGAVAERLKFNVYLIYTVVVTALVYPISGTLALGRRLDFPVRLCGFCRVYGCSCGRWFFGPRGRVASRPSHRQIQQRRLQQRHPWP